MINKNKIGEKECVKKFLNNDGVIFSEDKIELSPEEPADIFCKDIDKKFQVVKADFDFWKEINTKKSNTRSLSLQEIFKKFVQEPLTKKAKYDKAAKGIILLIDSWCKLPLSEKQISLVKRIYNNHLKKYGFDEIYLVCPGKNISIFP